MFNFAAKLNCLLFTEEERRRSNVYGTQGKLQLDPNKDLQLGMLLLSHIQLTLTTRILCGGTA